VTLWLRARRAWLLAGALLLQFTLSCLLGGVLVPSPSLAAHATLDIPLRVFLPLILSCALVHALSDVIQLERGATRNTAVADGLLVAAVAASAVLLGLVAAALGSGDALVAARNTIGYVGFATAGAVVLGPPIGAMLPVAHVILVALLDSGRTHIALLAWPVEPLSSGVAALAAVSFCATGVLATARLGGVQISALDARGRR